MTHPELIERITRSLAYMLRHQPEQFDLQLDEYGWADLDEVVRALHERLGEVVSAEDVTDAVSSGDRQRYEVDSNRIRALYGHSIPVKPGEPARPPEHLYLGLSRRDADRAERNGLRPGRRQFLHLALSREDALESAQRNFEDCVLMEVQSLDAWEEGINFYDRRALFLSDPIPPHHLVRMEPRQRAEAAHTAEEGESAGFEGESSEEMSSGDSERPVEGEGPSRRRGRRGRRGRGRGRDSERDSHPQQREAAYEEQAEPQDERPEYREERPAQHEERPQYREERPARREDRPQYREDRPARREDRPQYREDRPARREDRPQYREDRPARREDRPQYREDRPSQRDERPQYREDRPARREERPQYREDRPPRREERPQYREDRPARREERPQYREDRPPRREERAPRAPASESFGEGLVDEAPVRREPARPAPAASRPTPPPPPRAVEPEEDNFGAGI